jgi:AraC-like DNA-binding protein
LVTDISSDLDLLNYIYAGICFLFFWLSYRGIYQFKLAEEKFEIRAIRSQKKGEGTPLVLVNKIQQENLYIERFKRLIDEEHLYRDPELNRDKVAAQLGISSGYFSQVFSQFFPQNFSEYINELRVGDVKRMLTEEAFQPYSLISIGFEAGFNSKSSFYAVFKRSTGMTPAAYKKQYHNYSSSKSKN